LPPRNAISVLSFTALVFFLAVVSSGAKADRTSAYLRPVGSNSAPRMLDASSITAGDKRPASDVATHSYSVFPARHSRSFELRASHGYHLTVVDLGPRVVLEVRTEARRVEYSARSAGRGNHIKARFGTLGFVDMRFDPEEEARHVKEPGCRGPGGFAQRGEVVGRFRWRGEKGFSFAAANRAPGIAINAPREVCRVRTLPHPVALFARSRLPSGRTVTVETEVIESHVDVTALVKESRDGLRIRRGLVSVRPRSAVSVNENGSVIVNPGPPFSGSAEFVPASAPQGGWRGSLDGEFAGLGNVRLAGRAFRAWRLDPGT
jgi:hypothetical protein